MSDAIVISDDERDGEDSMGENKSSMGENKSEAYFERFQYQLCKITSNKSYGAYKNLKDMCSKIGMVFESFSAQNASNISWDDAQRLLNDAGLPTSFAAYMQDSKCVSVNPQNVIARVSFDTTLEHANFSIPANYVVVGKNADGTPVTVYSDQHLIMMVNAYWNEWMMQNEGDIKNPTDAQYLVYKRWFKQVYTQRGNGPRSMEHSTRVIFYIKCNIAMIGGDVIDLNVETNAYGTALRFETTRVGNNISSVLKDKDRENTIKVGFVDYDNNFLLNEGKKPASLAFRFQTTETTFKEAVDNMAVAPGARRKIDEVMIDMDSIICPISFENMKDPVIDPEGNSYERSAIEKWLDMNKTSPLTRSPLNVKDLVTNRALKDMIHRISSDMVEQMPEENDLPFTVKCKSSISHVSILSMPLQVVKKATFALAKGGATRSARSATRGGGGNPLPVVRDMPKLELFTTTAEVSNHVIGHMEPLKTLIHENDELVLRPACVMTLNVVLTADPKGDIDAIDEEFAAMVYENFLKTMLVLQQDMEAIPNGTKFASISKQPTAQYEGGSEGEHLAKNIQLVKAVPNPCSGTTQNIQALLADNDDAMQDDDAVQDVIQFEQEIGDMLNITVVCRYDKDDEESYPMVLAPGYKQTKTDLTYLVDNSMVGDNVHFLVGIKNISTQIIKFTPMYFGDNDDDDYSGEITLEDGESDELCPLTPECEGKKSGWKLKTQEYGKTIFTVTFIK